MLNMKFRTKYNSKKKNKKTILENYKIKDYTALWFFVNFILYLEKK